MSAVYNWSLATVVMHVKQTIQNGNRYQGRGQYISFEINIDDVIPKGMEM